MGSLTRQKKFIVTFTSHKNVAFLFQIKMIKYSHVPISKEICSITDANFYLFMELILACELHVRYAQGLLLLTVLKRIMADGGDVQTEILQ